MEDKYIYIQKTVWEQLINFWSFKVKSSTEVSWTFFYNISSSYQILSFNGMSLFFQIQMNLV